MWYSKADGGKIEAHTTKMWAISRCNIHAGCGEDAALLGLYTKDHRKNPEAVNLLPVEIAKARTKRLTAQLRQMMKRPRKGARP